MNGSKSVCVLEGQNIVTFPEAEVVHKNNSSKTDPSSNFIVLSQRKIIRKKSLKENDICTTELKSPKTLKLKLNPNTFKKIKSPKKKASCYSNQQYPTNKIEYVTKNNL